jgi:hypothetical protein
MVSETTKFAKRLCPEGPPEVLEEVNEIIGLVFPQFDFAPMQNVFEDIVRLYCGQYPGYRQCNTGYHDLEHTTDCFLGMARLIHGAFINGIIFDQRNVTLGLISALIHDTGYIQIREDDTGTGGKYTRVHLERSMEFMERYFLENTYSLEDFRFCANCLTCTSLEVNIREIPFASRDNEILGQMLGTADLVGQLSARNYLAKLPFLYEELKEGGVPGCQDELDLLKKTPHFWEFVKKRLVTELGHVDRHLRDHFKVRWRIDRDLDREAIEGNMADLKFILENHESDYRKYLRRSDKDYPGELGKLSGLPARTGGKGLPG